MGAETSTHSVISQLRTSASIERRSRNEESDGNSNFQSHWTKAKFNFLIFVSSICSLFLTNWPAKVLRVFKIQAWWATGGRTLWNLEAEFLFPMDNGCKLCFNPGWKVRGWWGYHQKLPLRRVADSLEFRHCPYAIDDIACLRLDLISDSFSSFFKLCFNSLLLQNIFNSVSEWSLRFSLPLERRSKEFGCQWIRFGSDGISFLSFRQFSSNYKVVYNSAIPQHVDELFPLKK